MTDEFKKAMEAAKTREEMLAIAREFGHELGTFSDAELDAVAGGKGALCECVDAEHNCVKC